MDMPQGEGHPPRPPKGRRNDDLDQHNIVTEARVRNVSRKPFCPPRVRKGECYASQGACLQDKENRIARSEAASKPPGAPLVAQAPPGPSFSLLGHGSPASSQSSTEATQLDDHQEMVPDGTANVPPAVPWSQDEDENPFKDDSYPPSLRGPGDGFTTLPARSKSGVASSQDSDGADALLALADQNKFRALADSLPDHDAADDVPVVEVVVPEKEAIGKAKRPVPPNDAQSAAAQGPKKRKSTSPQPRLSCEDALNGNTTGVRQFNLMFENFTKPDEKTFEGFRPFKEYESAFVEFDKWHSPDGELKFAPVRRSLKIIFSISLTVFTALHRLTDSKNLDMSIAISSWSCLCTQNA